MRIAKWAKQQNFRTNYYISPQVWASRPKRIKSIKRDIDLMFVILPFEKEFYEKHKYKVYFVGHPLIDSIANREQVSEKAFRNQYHLNDNPIITLLPGSRKQEISKMLPIFLSVVDKFKEYQFVIAGAPSQNDNFYKKFIKNTKVQLISNKTYDLLSISYAALVASGTATLETALLKVPQVVCYKANTVSYQIAKRVVTLQYISLVNLIMNKEVVEELIQHKLTSKNLNKALGAILNQTNRISMFENYYELEKKLGGVGASNKTAKLILEQFS